MIIGEKNTDLKRLTWRLKLRLNLLKGSLHCHTFFGWSGIQDGCHWRIQGSPNQAKWVTSLPWFQWNRPTSVKKRSFSRHVSLFKSVFFSPIIRLNQSCSFWENVNLNSSRCPILTYIKWWWTNKRSIRQTCITTCTCTLCSLLNGSTCALVVSEKRSVEHFHIGPVHLYG
jgi:hypothetical protein